MDSETLIHALALKLEDVASTIEMVAEKDGYVPLYLIRQAQSILEKIEETK